MYEDGLATLGAFGDAAPWIPQVEAELCAYAHDVVHAHHDRDYRALQVYATEMIASAGFAVWRVSQWGHLGLDILRGWSHQPVGQLRHLLIHRGHMWLPRPLGNATSEQFIRMVHGAGKTIHEYVCAPWPEHLEAADPVAPLISGRAPRCALCRPPPAGVWVGRSLQEEEAMEVALRYRLAWCSGLGLRRMRLDPHVDAAGMPVNPRQVVACVPCRMCVVFHVSSHK